MVPELNKLCSMCERVLGACVDDCNVVTKRAFTKRDSTGTPTGTSTGTLTGTSCGIHSQIGNELGGTLHPHHASITDLEDSAGHGCHLCTLIRLHLPSQHHFDGHHPLFIRQQIPRLGLYPRHWNVEIEEASTVIDLQISHSSHQPGNPPPTVCTALAHFNNRGDPPTGIFGMLNYWFGICRAKHEACRRVATSVLPSRVIDVFGKDSGGNPYLLSTSQQRDIYITLSHRWGPKPKLLLQTTSGNAGAHYEGIDLKSLPQTFLDAVLVCRQLGVRYLWIDSLCIIQDDKSDWVRESEKMTDIYYNSACNLAADAAFDCSTGLSIRRNVLQVSPCFFQRAGDQAKVSPLGGGYSLAIGENDIRSHLDSRGWVLQERILPPRTVHFFPSQLVWECQETLASELKYLQDNTDPTTDNFRGSTIYGSSLPPRSMCLGRHGLNKELLLDFRRSYLLKYFRLPADKIPSMSIYSFWYAIVENYSARQLTHKEDRLPAIWGLAQRFQEMTGGHYVAGLWEEDILAGLVFSSKKYGMQPSSGAESATQAPSWSWAAHDGEVEYPVDVYGNLRRVYRYSDLEDAEVIRINVEAGPNTMGMTKRAELVLSAYVSADRITNKRVLFAHLKNGHGIRVIETGKSDGEYRRYGWDVALEWSVDRSWEKIIMKLV